MLCFRYKHVRTYFWQKSLHVWSFPPDFHLEKVTHQISTLIPVLNSAAFDEKKILFGLRRKKIIVTEPNFLSNARSMRDICFRQKIILYSTSYIKLLSFTNLFRDEIHNNLDETSQQSYFTFSYLDSTILLVV